MTSIDFFSLIADIFVVKYRIRIFWIFWIFQFEYQTVGNVPTRFTSHKVLKNKPLYDLQCKMSCNSGFEIFTDELFALSFCKLSSIQI